MFHKKALTGGSAITLLGGSAGALLLALAASPASAAGTTYTVDTLDDGPGQSSDCTTPVPGSCSLRDAVAAVTGGDSIVFASGLTGTITLVSGEIEIGDEITLTGPGAANLTVDAGGSSRVFYLCAGPAMEISGVTITGGSDKGAAALYDECGDGFTLREVVVTGNTSTSGKAVLYSQGNTFIYDSVITDNTSAGEGGGIFVDGDLVIKNSVVSGNSTSRGDGGGINVSGNLVMDSTTVDDNYASNGGGGVVINGNGGTHVISNSTFSNNVAGRNRGGAIAIAGLNNSLTITNSTIAGNSASVGGGIHCRSTNELTLQQVTVTGNSATSSNPLYSGGGIHLGNANSLLTLSGSIVSGNRAAAGPADISYGFNGPNAPVSINANHSLLGELDSALTVSGANNVNSTTPGLAALANNGGATKTMSLLAGSPAAGAGPFPVPTFNGSDFDQRGIGYPRSINGVTDIGAFQTQPSSVPNSDPVAPAFTG